ncbi:hypothetical protein GCM10027280_20700 [Micromonospora polyrhachis]
MSNAGPCSGIDPAETNDYLGSSVAIHDLDGTGPPEMFVESRYELPVSLQRPADFSTPGARVIRLQNGPLSAWTMAERGRCTFDPDPDLGAPRIISVSRR